MTLPKISSIWRRTSTWLDRSSFGSRSWMTRFWIRNLTSRNDSRTGAWLVSRPASWARRRSARRRGRQVGARARPARRPVPGGTRSSALDPLQEGHRLHPFSPRGAHYVPCSAPCEQRFLLGRLADCRRRAGLRSLADDGPGQSQDVLGDLRLPVGQEERYATVEGVDHAPAVADDRVVDLAADRVLDVRDADAERRVGAVEDQPDLARSRSRAARRPRGRGACS